MPAAQWTRIQDLFLEASELPRPEREQLLDRETGGDVELRRAVESLLLAADSTGGFLTRALSGAAAGIVEAQTPQPGDRFGAYEWKRTLGEGGMGSVFLAERADGAYRKQVAIKVVRAGLDTPAARGRFREERQILAGMEHANIARLLEGGETSDGLPYVVMEYIDGAPIDEYCRERGLGIDARIALFRQVCAGVSYAHRNLVVHRDLKPGNILVTADGTAKLVDFGIAKSLGAAGVLTVSGERALTPNYASPEQVLGRHITPASDIYSLGVVLYELLSGKGPYELTAATASAIEKVICEQDPPRASAAAGKDAGRLRGDLDNIIAKAMRKDPAMRYESVDALSADLERYVNRFPVQAAPLSASYRIGKFLRRNRWGALIAALCLIAAVAFVVTIIRERNTAQREREKAGQVAQFLADSFRAASPEQARGRVVTAKDILDRGASRIETELAKQPDVRATLMRIIGVVYSSIGEYKRGQELVDKAVETRSRAGGDVAPEELVRDAMSAGGVRYLAGDRDGGLKQLEEAAKLQERLAPRDMQLRGALLSDLGRAYTQRSKFVEAEKTLLAAIEARKKAGDQARLADAYSRLSQVYGYQGKYDKAIPMELEALAVLVRMNGEYHPSVVMSYQALVRNYGEGGKPAEAVKYGEKAAASARKLYGPTQAALADALAALGLAYSHAGRYEESLRVHEEALEIWRKNPLERGDLQSGLSNVGKLYQNLGRHDKFFALTKEAVELARESKKVNATLLNNWGVAQRQHGDLEEALATMQQVMAVVSKSLPADHVNLAHMRLNLALVLIDLQRHAEAERLLVQADETYRKKLPPGHWIPAWAAVRRAECRLAARDIAGAREIAGKAAKILESAKHETAAAGLFQLGRTYLAEGDAAQAAGLLTRALELERRPSAFHDTFTIAVAEATLGKALGKQGRVEEAAKLRSSAAAVLAKHPGHLRLRAALRE